MTAVPGLLVKSGAEGVEAFAAADGRAGRGEDRGWRAPRRDARDGGIAAGARHRRGSDRA